MTSRPDQAPFAPRPRAPDPSPLPPVEYVSPAALGAAPVSPVGPGGVPDRPAATAPPEPSERTAARPAPTTKRRTARAPRRRTAAKAPGTAPDGPRGDALGGRITYRLDELAEAFGISRRTLERERSAGRFPKPDLIVSRRIPLWTPATITAWVAAGGGRA
jgi:hypothetical protein